MGPRTTDGLLLVDKPAGMTSHDVVSVARRAVGPSRVGHAGTLDPFATGLLVLLVGRGTRLIPYLDAEPKVYDATIRFGAETDTDDSTGRVMRESALPAPAAVDAALATMVGDLEQRPPAYSAKQVEGVRAYAAARRGRPLDLAPVTVRVHAWTVRERRDAELDVTVICGGGTYVRALARDLGRSRGERGAPHRAAPHARRPVRRGRRSNDRRRPARRSAPPASPRRGGPLPSAAPGRGRRTARGSRPSRAGAHPRRVGRPHGRWRIARRGGAARRRLAAQGRDRR